MAEVQCTVDSIRVGAAFADELTLILRRKHADGYVPVSISKHQGQILADELNGRPDSKDELEAFLNCINATESDIGSATVYLEGDCFFAKVLLSPDRRPHEVRCPIGVALALTVRAGAPIFLDEAVFEKIGVCLSADPY
jgi:bifunctional DNase/RNase